MSKKKIRFLISISLLIFFIVSSLVKSTFSPEKKVLSVNDTSISLQNVATVLKVVDGDTIKVLINGKKETVRVIGINTPETVDPRKKVECFGKEASDKAKSLLSGQMVRLESDTTQSDRDKYGRVLRYVYLSNNLDFGLEMIKNGYAYEYTYEIPYSRQLVYKDAQKSAENMHLGLWGERGCR